jgi:hypothetical protein
VRPFAAIYSAIFSTHVKITHSNKYQFLGFSRKKYGEAWQEYEKVCKESSQISHTEQAQV